MTLLSIKLCCSNYKSQRLKTVRLFYICYGLQITEVILHNIKPTTLSRRTQNNHNVLVGTLVPPVCLKTS
ncbi:hypothetical protein CARUB_v10021255mg [Capsella rubella]|uniref:Uncharacterized protein n=1 Tax=Capsella rubella TaxID=81985 RepID=R0GJR5_9BRAS|nr:hypothetical protein CARUB_v10021255mg [Capsella rubella]